MLSRLRILFVAGDSARKAPAGDSDRRPARPPASGAFGDPAGAGLSVWNTRSSDRHEMSNPKNQHYIPRLILRRFSTDGKHLWTYNHDEGVMWRKIKKAFVERHIYTRNAVDTDNMASHSDDPKTFKQSITHDYVYENTISELESTAAPIIQRIVEHARRRECPRLSSSQSMVLKRFIFLAARRTPESQARVRSANEPDVFYRAAKAVADRQGFPLPDRDRLYEDRRVAVLENVVTRNSNASFAAGDVSCVREEIERFCRDTGIQILFCTADGD